MMTTTKLFLARLRAIILQTQAVQPLLAVAIQAELPLVEAPTLAPQQRPGHQAPRAQLVLWVPPVLKPPLSLLRVAALGEQVVTRVAEVLLAALVAALIQMALRQPSYLKLTKI
jgi:hypothetical protein